MGHNGFACFRSFHPACKCHRYWSDELFGISANNARVALARLSADGLIEAAERGSYALSARAHELADDVATWRTAEQRVRPWSGSWIAVHCGALGRSDRRAMRNRDRALGMLGFREFERGLYLRPDNIERDLDAVRNLFGSPVLLAFFDLPWTPIFIAAIFIFHPILDFIAIGGGVVLVVLTLMNQVRSKEPNAESQIASAQAENMGEAMRQNAEAVQGLGMRGIGMQRWYALRDKALKKQIEAYWAERGHDVTLFEASDQIGGQFLLARHIPGKEEFHAPGRRPFALPFRSPALYFVQRMRDEAHRFAIGAHRAKRAKAVGATPLDEVPGVGPGRKRALLAHFGSAKAVSRAGLADLKNVDGISASMAETIYAFFHGER
mgnify:CR=1 FL=1